MLILDLKLTGLGIKIDLLYIFNGPPWRSAAQLDRCVHAAIGGTRLKMFAFITFAPVSQHSL